MNKLLTAIFILFAIASFGQNKDKNRIDNVCDTVMIKFADGKVKEAMQLLKQNTVMANESIDTLQSTIISQMHAIFPDYGQMLSAEFVKEKTIKNIISKRYYIIKFSNFFLKAYFTLYNGSAGWTITHFLYNDEIDDVF